MGLPDKNIPIGEVEGENVDRQLFDSMDSVDRRDKRGHIFPIILGKQYRENYDQIQW